MLVLALLIVLAVGATFWVMLIGEAVESWGVRAEARRWLDSDAKRRGVPRGHHG